MSRQQIDLKDVLALYVARKNLLKTDLTNIELLYDGQPIADNDWYSANPIEQQLVAAEWKYTGLNKIDYLIVVLEEIGVHVKDAVTSCNITTVSNVGVEETTYTLRDWALLKKERQNK